jgi:hypothetical protein
MQSTAEDWQDNTSPLPFANQMEGIAYLGPAEVVGIEATGFEVRLPNSAVVEASPAFTIPYRARLGDILLVIGGPRGHWAIGVVHGSGATELAMRGDVELRAVGGELRLSGDRGVVVEGPEVDIEAGRLRVAAETVFEKFGTLHRRVRELISTRAGRHHAIVDGDSITTTQRSTLLAEESVTINGKAVMLG